jgi:hypothetical protein
VDKSTGHLKSVRNPLQEQAEYGVESLMEQFTCVAQVMRN